VLCVKGFYRSAREPFLGGLLSLLATVLYSKNSYESVYNSNAPIISNPENNILPINNNLSCPLPPINFWMNDYDSICKNDALSKVTSEFEESQEQLKSLEKNISEITSKLQNALSDTEAKNKAINTLEAKLTGVQERLSAELNNLAKMTAQAQHETDSLSAEKLNFEKLGEKLNGSIVEQRKQAARIIALKNEASKITSELQNAKSEIELKNTAIDELNVKVESIEEQLREQSILTENAIIKQNEQEQDVIALKQDLSNAKSMIDLKNTAIDELNVKVESVNEQFKQVDIHNQNIMDELNAKKIHLDAITKQAKLAESSLEIEILAWFTKCLFS